MISTLSKKHNFDTVFDSQKVFRLILEAMSNPARVVNISEYANKLFGDFMAFLAISMTLLDNEVSFNACGNCLLSDVIESQTLAKREKLESADFVFVCDPNNIKNVIKSIKYGTLADPHKSATVIILNDGASDCLLTIFGPGIDGHATVQVTQTVKDAIAIRDAQHYEYPQGLDLIFISNDGGLFAIPRLTRMVK